MLCVTRMLVLVVASLFGQAATASHYRLELTDYVGVGSPSGLRIGGLCGSVEVFPAESCNYDVAGLNLQVMSASDEALSIQAFGINLPLETQPFDRFVSFRNMGSLGPVPDDVLRVRWLPASFSLSIDLMSGSMVSDYLVNELAQATEMAQIVALPSELVLGQSAWFGDWQKLGPANNPVLLSIVPNATVSEPSTIALALAALGLGGIIQTRRRLAFPSIKLERVERC